MLDSLRLSLRLRLFIGPIEPISDLSWPNFLHIKAHSQVHSRYFLGSQFYHFDCTQFDSTQTKRAISAICLTPQHQDSNIDCPMCSVVTHLDQKGHSNPFRQTRAHIQNHCSRTGRAGIGGFIQNCKRMSLRASSSRSGQLGITGGLADSDIPPTGGSDNRVVMLDCADLGIDFDTANASPSSNPSSIFPQHHCLSTTKKLDEPRATIVTRSLRHAISGTSDSAYDIRLIPHHCSFLPSRHVPRTNTHAPHHLAQEGGNAQSSGKETWLSCTPEKWWDAGCHVCPG